MRPQDVLLVGVALLAVLFLIGGLIDGVRFSRTRVGRRRREPVPGRRKVGLTELKEEWMEAESLPRRRGTLLRDTSSVPQPLLAPELPAPLTLERPKAPVEPISPVMSEAAVMPAPREVGWPARQPRGATAPGHPPSTFSRNERTAASNQHKQPPPEDLEAAKLVVRYANGKVIKGYSHDFYPRKPVFHLLPPTAGFSFTDEAIEVRIKDLKAVFFMRDFWGDPSYNERKSFAEDERPPGRKVEVTFKDREVLVGSTLGYDPRRLGFFFIPADPKSNILKVFAVTTAVSNVRFL
jgi:hypothetical protein